MTVSIDDKKTKQPFLIAISKGENQLVRNTFENYIVAMPNNIGNSDV